MKHTTHVQSEKQARELLEDGAEIGPRLWNCHNIWVNKKCVGRISDKLFSKLLPSLTRATGGYEVRWRIET